MQIQINSNIIIIDDEDYNKIKDITWYIHENRASAKINGRWWKMHNFIMGTRHLIDHKDMNGLNNSKSNLRLANKSTNAMNTIISSNNSSGVKGISWNRDKEMWHSYITINQKRQFLGYYRDIKEAALIRIIKELELFGEFSNKKYIKSICEQFNFDYEYILRRRPTCEL